MNILNKVVKYATQIGLDEEELLNMTVLEAIQAIEDVQFMWKNLIKDAE